MRRYFYSGNTILAKWLQKNAFAKSFEDERYRSAFLGAIRNGQRNYDQLREQILNMTIEEQEKYATNIHIEQLFTHFHSFYRYSRGRQMIVDSHKFQETTALVDPDKFPIWDTKNYAPVYRSLWDHHLAQLRFDLGFQPIIRDSQIQHIAGGRGVYIVLSSFKNKIGVGELIGLVPGKIYSSLQDFKVVTLKNKKQYHRIPQHLHFPSGKILVLGDIAKQRAIPFGLKHNQSQVVDGTYHNPYAVGHMINHPPPGYEANVCFSQIKIPPKYFPSHLLRYLPYEYFNFADKTINLFGIFSLRELEDKEELFVNYNESHIYQIDDIPEWLLEPVAFDPIFNYLKKGEYELAEEGYWKYMEEKALQKNKGLYEQYQKLKIMRPDNVVFQDKNRTYRRLKLRVGDENEYEHI